MDQRPSAARVDPTGCAQQATSRDELPLVMR